ncbi:MAG: TRAP transporter large permease [Dehalococcoidia bacterium]|jgi:C4-dicarboxylate transporter DctM subunit|nr:TRAP transporter large permease [Dehalococcoidia bacterium]
MALMLIVLFGLLLVGAPIGVALGGSALLYMIVYTYMDPSLAPAAFFEFLNGYGLMAAPFFIFAGMLMEKTQLLGQIFSFADSLLGWVKGGMGAAGLVTAVILAALTGSSVAAASALALIVVPRMVAVGHPKAYAAGLVCAGGSLAQLIPPSVWMIVYAIMTENSIAVLFAAGVIPGLLLASLLIALNMFQSRNQDIILTKFSWHKVGTSFIRCLPGLGLPVLILGGLYGGIFTPTEAGAAACGYAILYGYIANKGRFTKGLLSAAKPAVRTTAMLFFLLGCVGIFQNIAANMYWPQDLVEWAMTLGMTRYAFLFGYMAIGLILGCFLDGLAILALTVPVVYPLGLALGVDPIHLCVLLVLNLQIGTLTPPLGLNVYAVAGCAKLPVVDVFRTSIPFFFAILAFLIVVVLLPSLSTWLPSLVVNTVVFAGLG